MSIGCLGLVSVSGLRALVGVFRGLFSFLLGMITGLEFFFPFQLQERSSHNSV